MEKLRGKFGKKMSGLRRNNSGGKERKPVAGNGGQYENLEFSAQEPSQAGPKRREGD